MSTRYFGLEHPAMHTFQKDWLCQYFAANLVAFAVVLATSVSIANVIASQF